MQEIINNNDYGCRYEHSYQINRPFSSESTYYLIYYKTTSLRHGLQGN